ncbi:ABC transporter ATP-binding protein [Cryobacterium sp. PH31-O1]|uniref:ABC transporter ATP-binding protein n=1 Tax=Cryobacterium sp. PH31-O1 TaxID=3046306 RepID=UPI0024BB42AE|nr:ABC transporter ATP-binding protein [Cryobacterium sp. PH31-O1]MDJ0339274.1 ABC transporter ATP-binding protein [Cryobacterium sp. PH31-O1]
MSHDALTQPRAVLGPGQAPDAAIDVVDLVKQFGRNRALNGVTFQVPRGSVFGVIGPNGAGKTTIMRALLDIIRPTSGHATVLGTPSRNAGPELRRRIGYLPGELILEGRTSGRRLLAHYADISGPVAAGHVHELAERLGFDLDRPVRKLSKGNKQKLGIVQAFMHQPELLVLDEPTSGLDPLMQQEFLKMVREARDRGQTVFLSSHVISEIQQAADEVAILRDGRIVTINSVEELRTTAIRHLRLVASGIRPTDLAAALGALEGVTTLECTVTPAGDAEAVATLSSEIAPFLQAISTLQLKDLMLEEPDLEESVLKLYSAPMPAAAAAGLARHADAQTDVTK